MAEITFAARRGLHASEDFAGWTGADVLGRGGGDFDGQSLQRSGRLFSAHIFQSIGNFARIARIAWMALNFLKQFVAHGGLQFSVR